MLMSLGKKMAKTKENWLVFEKSLSIPDSADKVRVEIGFRFEAKTNSQPKGIMRITESPLVVYFPTEKQTRFGFLMQGPYRTTPARDNIPKDDDWNKTLVQETAALIVEALQHLKEMGLLTVALLEALPTRMDDFPENGMFYPVGRSRQSRDALRDRNCSLPMTGPLSLRETQTGQPRMVARSC